MENKKKTKYLLTTSEDKDVIIAEVPHNHPFNEGERIVSQGMIDVNVKAGLFKEVTGQVDWEGKIWMLTEDMN
jgi:hypothetical protein